MLATLVLGGGDVVSADRLIDALWGDAPPRSAAKTLQNYVLKLRKALGPDAIETQAPGYRLVVDGQGIDARRFDALLRSAGEDRAAGRPDEAAAQVRAALALWRGSPLDELEDWAPARAEAARLIELRQVATEELVDAEIASGRPAPVVAELEAMVAAEPLRERRWAMLMLALYRCGRQADALRTYQRARTLLADQLGIEPGPELRALELAIAQQDPALELPAGSTDGQVPGDDDDSDSFPPYQGLAPFEPEDRSRFFGRAVLVDDLLARAERERFVAIVGASGAGKSSVVRAGVLGALRGGALAGSDAWLTLVMTPGSRPLAELASGIAPVVDCRASDVLDRLESDPATLTAVVRDRIRPGPRLVLVVDQLEELFTQSRDELERRQFVDSLVSAVRDPNGAVTVIVALRADFYGQCSAYPDLAGLLDEGATLLCPMVPDEIRAAVDGPAELAGLEVQPGLTELIVRDVGEEPGALPLLSHALLETWKRRTRRTLTVAGYRQAGGVHGAIAKTAESVYRGFDPTEQARARHVFLRLTELGDGTEDTSRRVPRDELVPSAEAAPTDLVLAQLADARLVTLDRDSVQVAHEALIREWPRLRTWLDEDRDGRRIHRHLTHAARDWEALGREPSELYRGPRLATASEWLARDDHASELNVLERDFLGASAAAADADRAAVVERARARERSNRVLRRLLGAVAIMLVVALIAGAVAFIQRGRADNEAAAARRSSRTADVSRLVAQSGALRSENVHVGALLALEANRLHNDAETQGALFSTVVADPRRMRTIPTGTSEGIWAIPGASTVLVLSHGELRTWDVRTGRRLLRLPIRGVQTAAVRNDGMIAAVRADGTVAFFAANGTASGATIRSHLHGVVANAAFSPDGHTIAVAFGDWAHPGRVDPGNTVRLYDVASRTSGSAISGPLSDVSAIAFSPDGRRLALGDANDEVAFRDVASGRVTRSPITAGAPVIGIAFDPRRDRLAIGSVEPTVTVRELSTGALIANLVDAPGVDQPVYDPSGRLLLVAGNGPVRVYDADTLTPMQNRAAPGFAPAIPAGEPLDVQNAQARVVFTTGGQMVVGGPSGPATVWDAEGISVLDRVLPGALSYVFPMVGGSSLQLPTSPTR